VWVGFTHNEKENQNKKEMEYALARPTQKSEKIKIKTIRMG